MTPQEQHAVARVLFLDTHALHEWEKAVPVVKAYYNDLAEVIIRAVELQRAKYGAIPKPH
jgi:hypothetical protein